MFNAPGGVLKWILKFSPEVSDKHLLKLVNYDNQTLQIISIVGMVSKETGAASVGN